MLKERNTLQRFISNPARLEYLLLLVIILLAAGLRFYKLGAWSLWGDEAFSLSTEEDGFNYSLLRRSLAIDLIHLTTGWLGVSEWTGRLAPAVIGILTIPILYFPLKRAFNTHVALMTSLLLAISTWHLYWSQNIRFYTLLFLFYALGMLLFYIGLEEDRPLLILASLGMFGLAARESLTALFFVPVILGYLILLKLLPFPAPAGLRWRNVLIFFGPMALLGAFFAGPYLLNLSGWFAGFVRVNNTPLWLFSSVVYYIGLPALVLAASGSVALLGKKNRSALFLLVGGGVPWLLLIGLSLFQYAASRYVFIALICWLALAGLALQELDTQLRGRTRIFSLGLLILLAAFPAIEDFMYFKFNNGNREDWRSALAYVQAHRGTSDMIVVANKDVTHYYLPGEPVLDFEHWEAGETKGASRVWVIEDMNIEEMTPEKHLWLQEHAVEARNFDVQVWARNYYLRVFYYDAPAAGSG